MDTECKTREEVFFDRFNYKLSSFFHDDYTEFGNLTQAIEKAGIEVKKATLQRFPQNPVEFTEEQIADIDKLIEKLEDDDDVQAVYTNIA